MVISECGAHTVTTATKSSGSVVNLHTEQPACEKGYAFSLRCHVPTLDDNIDFGNYTGNIVSLSLRCDKKRYLPSRLLDGMFAPLGQTLKYINIYDCFIINISRQAFGGLERLQRLSIRGGSYPQMDNSWLEIPTVSNSTQPSQTNLALPSTTWYHDNLVLPEGVFSELHNLNSLELAAMRLNSSVWHAVKHLRNLNSLDLSNNNITIIDTNTINNLQHLTSLYLNGNHIQVIPNGTFESLSLLWYMGLSSNKIRLIEGEAFKGLSELEILLLSRNSITTIDRAIFQGLSKLYRLDLSENRIRTIDKGIFSGLSQLRALDLSENSIRIINKGIFSGLSQLRALDLSENSIRIINKGIFSGLSQLRALDLSRNNISRVDTGIFKGLSNMHTLNLAVNKISIVEMDTFNGLSNLSELYLAENRVRILSHLTLSRLSLLRILELSCNLIETIPKLPISLTSLNLRNNSIRGVDKISLAGLQRLTHLDLSHNKISECTRCNIPYTMEKWNVSSNEVSVASFNMTSKLVFADFTYNKLKSLTISGLKNYRYAWVPANIYLAGNGDPFRCTCNMEAFKNESTFNYDSSSVERYQIWNFTSLNCKSVSDNTQAAGITDISARKFACSTTCYENCTCYHWKYGGDNINIVDCLGAGLAAVPINISVSCTILDLSGNMFPSLGPDNFDSLSQLVELYLNSSNITEIKKCVFRELSYLRKLDLSNNGMSILNSGIFRGLSRLLSLDLSLNSLHVVAEGAFKDFDRLNNLDLAGNELENISSSDIESMSTTKSLQLSNNPWSCDCGFLETFKPFTTDNAKHIEDYIDIICLTSDKTEHYLFQIDLAKFCPQDDRTVYIVLTDPRGYIIAGVLLFITIVFGILFKNREFIKILCFMTCGWRPGNNEMDRQYDAFISYSSDDNAFIVRELMPRLEEPGHNRPAYQLCVHFRDFPVGACIANTILAAINRSKRVIVILSNNFLNSAWCHYEFQAAHYQLIEEKKSRIIMVLLHEIDTNLLDAKLKLYLRTRTYVKYGDPLFWNKIEYAMPKLEDVAENPVADDVRLIP